jgi:hypothetical protein
MTGSGPSTARGTWMFSDRQSSAPVNVGGEPGG